MVAVVEVKVPFAVGNDADWTRKTGRGPETLLRARLADVPCYYYCRVVRKKLCDSVAFVGYAEHAPAERVPYWRRQHRHLEFVLTSAL